MLKLRNIYSGFLTLVGVTIVIWGAWLFLNADDKITLLLLLLIAIAAQSTMTYMVGGRFGVSVSGAMSYAVVGLYDPITGGAVAAIAEIGLWVVNLRSGQRVWKAELERLGVNAGMQAISICLAGVAFYVANSLLGGDTILARTVPWLVGAVVGDQVNFWLLAMIIFLAHGIKPLEMWHDNRWAVPMNVTVMTVGGGLVYTAVSLFGLLGLAIFVLPIILSAYSFRVTVNNAKKQMDNLEDLVALRTQALAEANDELERLNKEKDQFLAVLTHDMRTPLTSIKGYGSILRDRELSREQQVQIANVVLRSQETLLEIVNNILDLEKMTSGAGLELDLSEFDLALLAKSTAETVQAQALEKQISLKFDPVPTPILITADEKKIERVLTNLISNAIKYTPKAGEVEVAVSANGRYALVEIADSGYGIPEDELPYIFDRYSRVKGHQNLAIGTGLGLAIVKNLVEAHLGFISVDSEVDKGSTFTVRLPLNQP
ncbi:MAG: HAMP domain-containing histidine kinase [Anaerolineae bacterium]|nr:HAMP domain-containing histidine kinase [Anaerolineae bacterium]